MTSVNVRNLEQIQEAESGRVASRLGAMVLGSLVIGGLALAFAMLKARDDEPARSSVDPLDALIQENKDNGASKRRLEGADVTFPGLLSDGEHPTTAMVALKDERGRLVKQPSTEAEPQLPPPPTDRLPVVPLTTDAVLNATPVTLAPRDPLSQLATTAADMAGEASELAPAGTDEGFQLQVASFKEQADADALVEKLRRRGHSAFRKVAEVPGRGLWHRVRVGPFKNKYQATLYRKKFEEQERLAPFVVDPTKLKQAEEIREAKLAARERKATR